MKASWMVTPMRWLISSDTASLVNNERPRSPDKRVLCPFDVLDIQRLVEAVAFRDLDDLLGLGIVAGELLGEIAGQPQQAEADHGDRDRHEHRDDESAHDEPAHELPAPPDFALSLQHVFVVAAHHRSDRLAGANMFCHLVLARHDALRGVEHAADIGGGNEDHGAFVGDDIVARRDR